jgi:UDPglucose 6-dehydrogenase
MKVTVIGTGYVGLVSGTCLAELGNDVVCLDVDPAKIKVLLDGGMPIYEPGLQDLVGRNVAAGRLHFTTDVEHAVQHGTVQFIAVGTPPDEDGSADLQYVTAAARSIGRRAGKAWRGHTLQRGQQPRVFERGRSGRRLYAARPHCGWL